LNDEFFRALESERTSALVARDMAVIERLHAQEYELITPAGVVFSRARYLAAIAAAPFYAAWAHGAMQVRATQSMALVRYPAKISFPSGSVVDCWHTDSYELRGDIWQAVWSQATRRPAPQVVAGA
jgi:hypothetical protein